MSTVHLLSFQLFSYYEIQSPIVVEYDVKNGPFSFPTEAAHMAWIWQHIGGDWTHNQKIFDFVRSLLEEESVHARKKNPTGTKSIGRCL